jgi:predicted porin
MVKYVTLNWGVASGYSRQHGGAGAAGGLTTSGRTDDRATLNGYFKTDAFKVGLGWIGRLNDGTPAQQRSNMYWVEGSYALSPAIALEALVGRLKYANSATGDRSTLYALRALYNFSKRSAVYVTAGRMNNHGAQALSVSSGGPGVSPIAGNGQTGVTMGVRTTF